MTIELPDERIDAMRANVLDGVNADINRRGRRGRKAIAGGVGALAVLTVFGLVAPSLTQVNNNPVIAADAPAASRADGDASAAGGAAEGYAANEAATMSRQTATSDLAAKDIAPAPMPP